MRAEPGKVLAKYAKHAKGSRDGLWTVSIPPNLCDLGELGERRIRIGHASGAGEVLAKYAKGAKGKPGWVGEVLAKHAKHAKEKRDGFIDCFDPSEPLRT